MDKALEEDVSFAGEPNGHYSILDFVPYNSGTLTALILAGTDIEKSLEQKPAYHVERYSFETEGKQEKMERIKERVKEKYSFISDIDGVKFETDSLDVLVRPSGSSPKIREIAEAETEEELEKGVGELRKVIEQA